MAKLGATTQNSTASAQMGGDGWFTLLLSTLLIVMLGGVSLFWQGRNVLRNARNTTTTSDKRLELMLVPGMRLSTGKPNHDFRQRLKRARKLHWQYGGDILLLGGITDVDSVSEAAAGRQYLEEHGVPATALQLEDRSRNTLENLRNAREQLLERGITRYALISSRYHLARCQALANGLGMYPELCAAEERFSASPAAWPRLLLEAYYLHWYYTGKLWSRLTQNKHSLSRIS